MPPETSPPHTIRFGEDLELDRRAFQLRRAGQALKLERIPFDILLLLIERRGHLVTREQIAERIWGKDVFLDVDNSINGAMRKIRQALRDDSEHPRFIQTVTGRGYRFMAPALETGERPVSQPTPSPAAATHAANPWTRRAMLTLLVVAVIAAGLWWVRGRGSGGGRVMLAVLPFQNLTGDARQEYFSDGLTEEMITQLGNRDPEKLGVIARTSVMHYKNTPETLDRIEAELGVQYVLTGSVRRDANTVRVTAQLVQAKDQTQVWARQYDRAPQALLTLQGEIATEIADEIQSRLGGAGRAPADASPTGAQPRLDAYDLYLKGEYLANERSAADLQAAIAYFERAIARDSGFARAYAALADAYVLLVGYSQVPSGTLVARARAAVQRALALDPSLPEAHTALALIVQNYDWDWTTAEEEFKRAIALNPNYSTAHHWYAEHLMWRGRFAEALLESERARRLDPLSLIIASDNAVILLYARQYDRAIQKFRSVLAIDPDFPRAHEIQAAYVEKGMYAEALADIEIFRSRVPPPLYWASRTIVYGRWGHMTEARAALRELLQTGRRYPVQAGVYAGAYLSVRDYDQALTWLERAADERSNDIVGLKVNPSADPLRSNPRYQRLLERVGLAP